MDKQLLSLYGLKWNPFCPDIPTEALHRHAGFNTFCWRVEHTLIREGGFALVTGAGKSVTLRLLAEHLRGLRDISVVLVGDKRLTNKLRQDDLQPLGTRIRTRLNMEYASREDLTACLQHLLHSAGNATLVSEQLMYTLCEHAVGNYRILMGLAAELLATAAEQELPHLDEKLYLQCFGATPQAPQKQTR